MLFDFALVFLVQYSFAIPLTINSIPLATTTSSSSKSNVLPTTLSNSFAFSSTTLAPATFSMVLTSSPAFVTSTAVVTSTDVVTSTSMVTVTALVASSLIGSANAALATSKASPSTTQDSKFVPTATPITTAANIAPNTSPRKAWAGVNSYFLHTLPTSDQEKILSALSEAKVKVVRIFITFFYQGGKSTKSFGSQDLEMNNIGVYDDSVLKQIDQMMPLMLKYGVKLMIAMHDRWNLDNTWGTCDAYCQKFGVTNFYSSPEAASAFDNRLAHIATHVNPMMGNRQWKDIPEVIYAFEIQNEGQGTGASGGPSSFIPNWWCDRATALKNLLSTGCSVLISTGGGQNFKQSVISENFNCPALDIVALHSYDLDIKGVRSTLQSASANANKLVIFEEFGSVSNNGDWIKQVAEVAYETGVPFMPWEISSVAVKGDFEFAPGDDNFQKFASAIK